MTSSEARERLIMRLKELAIITSPIVPYPEHRTVEEGKALRGNMVGTFTKNLLLKDKKGHLFLVVAHEDQAIDLKTLHKRLLASGRVGFAAPEQMRSVLEIEPGALTPFAIINDVECRVVVAIDGSLMKAGQLNFHPMVQTESIGVSPHDLLEFVTSCGREPRLINMNLAD